MRGARFTLSSGSPPPAPDLTLSQDFGPFDYRGDRHDLGPEGGQEHVVKRSKLTEEQIAFALKQAELGTSVAEVCRKMGISQATFYVWNEALCRRWAIQSFGG